MKNESINVKRRRFLIATSGLLGAAGIAGSIPFIASWLPSAKAKALGAPVDIDISNIEEGQKVTVEWRGKPIFVINRPESALKNLENIKDKLRDPNCNEQQQPAYIKNSHRAINKNIFVVIGICTHLGCVPIYKPKIGEIEPSWLGGFFCPCHGSKFDLAGRVYKGVPAPLNLVIPPHKYIGNKILRIGED